MCLCSHPSPLLSVPLRLHTRDPREFCLHTRDPHEFCLPAPQACILCLWAPSHSQSWSSFWRYITAAREAYLVVASYTREHRSHGDHPATLENHTAGAAQWQHNLTHVGGLAVGLEEGVRVVVAARLHVAQLLPGPRVQLRGPARTVE